MSINQIQMVGPRAEVQKQEKQKVDPFDQLLKGLQIANSAFGIAVDYQKIKESKLQQSALTDQNSAVLSGKEFADKAAQDMQPVDEGTPGSVLLKHRTGPGEADVETTPMMLKAKPKGGPETKTVGQTLLQQGEDGKWTPVYEGKGTPKEAKTREIKTLDKNGKPVTMIVEDKPGTSYPDQGPDSKPPSADQFKAGVFAKRMGQAEDVFGKLEADGYNRADKLSGAAATILPGAMQGDNTKKQEQAERNFVNALLRRESGSAISSEEFSSAEQQYFPRAGDSADLIEQKRQNRELATQGMTAEAGNAMAQIKMPEARPVKGGGSGTATAAPASKPKTVIQNGHTYNLNEKTGEYE